MKKQILILCALSLLLGDIALAQGNWVSADENVSSAVVSSTGQLTVSGTYTWVGNVDYRNDKHRATLTYALPPSVEVSTGTPSLVYAGSNTPVHGVTFTNTGKAWTCTFTAGTIFASGTKLKFSISDLEIKDDKAYQNQLASHFISFLSSPANEALMDNSGTAVFQTTINSALPVTLLDFNATLRGQGTSAKVDLTWKTEMELNADRFIIERSADASDWSEITSVKAKGNSSTTIDYQTVDKQPLLGKSYYRIKQMDQDNRFTYSEVRTVNNILTTDIKVYPNPTTDVLHVQYTVDELSDVEVKLLTIDGRVVKSILFHGRVGTNIVELNTSDLANGLYELNIFQNSKLINTTKVQKK